MPRVKKAQPEAKARRGRPRKADSQTKVTVSKTPAKTPTVSPVERVRRYFQTINLPKVNLQRVNRRYLIIAAVVVVLVALGYLANRFLVIAWVDGRPVTRIALYQQLESRYGADVKNQMIAETLIDSEAAKRGITVSDQEVNDQYQQFAAQYGGEDNVLASLQAQGIDPAQFRQQIRYQVLIKKMFGDVQVTDDEVNKYIQDNQDQYKDATDTAKLQADVRQQLIDQKTTQAFQDWLQTTLQSSRVVRV